MATILRAPVLSSYPSRKAQIVDLVPNLLLNTLAVVSASQPIQQEFSDNPRIRVSSQTELFSMAAVLRLPPAQKLPIGVNGYDELCQTRVRVGGQSDCASNLLTTTLSQVAAAPFVPFNDFWQVGKGKYAQVDLLQNVLIRDLVPAQLLPIGNNGEDFTQVARRAPAQADASANLLLNTLAATQQTPPPGALGFDDFGQPRVVGRPQDTGSAINLLSSTLSLTAGPFIPADTSQLNFIPRPQDTQPQNTLVRLPPGSVVVPLVPIDTTQRGRSAIAQDTQTPNLLIRVSIPAQILPIGVNGYDEPAQPRLIYRPQDTQTANSLIQVFAPGQIAAPVIPVDWAQRLKPVAPQGTESSNLLIRILAPAQTTAPVNAVDWTQPRVRGPSQDTNAPNVLLRDLPPAQLLPMGTNAEDLSFAPVRRFTQVDFAPNLLASTLSYPLPPVADDWTQVSVKRVHAQETSSYNLVLRGIAPFVPTLIGNPRYMIQHLRTRRWEVSSVSYLQFDPLDPTESVELTFNFVPDLPEGVILTGTPTVLFTTRVGQDTSPSTSVPNGLAGFNQAFTKVIVPVKGTVDGNKYAIKVECSTTDPELRLALTGVLEIMEGA
jgi:hypothetical protein